MLEYFKRFGVNDVSEDDRERYYREFKEEFEQQDGPVRFDETCFCSGTYCLMRERVRKFFKDGEDAMLERGLKPNLSLTLDDVYVQLDLKIHGFCGVETDPEEQSVPCLEFIFTPQKFYFDDMEDTLKHKLEEFEFKLIMNAFVSELSFTYMQIGRFILALLEPVAPKYDDFHHGYVVKVPFRIDKVSAIH